MRILIVGNHPALKDALAAVLASDKDEIATTTHDEALEFFLTEEPQAVIITEYSELVKGPGGYHSGYQTYQDIRSSSTDEKIVCCGFENCNFEDYLKFPFEISELKEKIRR